MIHIESVMIVYATIEDDYISSVAYVKCASKLFINDVYITLAFPEMNGTDKEHVIGRLISAMETMFGDDAKGMGINIELTRQQIRDKVIWRKRSVNLLNSYKCSVADKIISITDK